MSVKTFAALTAAAALIGCGGGGNYTSLSTTIGPRTVKADVDGEASISGSGDTATIRAGNRSIIVEPTRLLVDGTPRAAFPADAREIHVKLENGATTITVDGKPVPEP
jgi:hypothetical protein